jgi:hypothetical protein
MALEWIAKHGILSKGNVIVTGSVVANSFTGSLSGTASYALGIPTIKSGIVSGSVFLGNPRTTPITFSKPFAGNYTVSVLGELSATTWTVESKSSNGFVINSNRKDLLGTLVYWQAISIGEFY